MIVLFAPHFIHKKEEGDMRCRRLWILLAWFVVLTTLNSASAEENDKWSGTVKALLRMIGVDGKPS
ncbi:MAG: hypothetical protein GX147_09095 [Deltaproteobacteria bacterium]|jgi:hypothetical protein|nr:hypothetical protein [Deltaproteobacteria bacterium]